MTALIKAFHLILVMLLMGNIVALVLLSLKKSQAWHALRYTLLRALLWLLLLTILTGTFLVYPRHFNFHTHWILAAYLLAILCGALLLYPYRQQRQFAQGNLRYSLRSLWLERASLLISVFAFIVVIHDAVVKRTFF